MDIIISNAAGQPIYEQICRQIKGAIASGALKSGEPLPSIKCFAIVRQSRRPAAEKSALPVRQDYSFSSIRMSSIFFRS